MLELVHIMFARLIFVFARHTQKIEILAIYLDQCIRELVLYPSSIEEVSNKFFDGYQSNSSDRRIF